MRVAHRVQSIIDALASTQARLAVTAALAVVAVGAAWLVAPRIIRGVHRQLTARVLTDDRIPGDPTAFSIDFPTGIVVRLTQAVLLAAAALLALLVWGYVDLVMLAVASLADLLPVVVRLAVTLGIAGAALVTLDVVDARITAYAEASDTLTQHQQGVVYRVLQITVLVAAGIAALTIWGVDPSGLLVGAGFLGIVIGTAARTTIGSLIAGLVLMVARPFEIGDWIALADAEGTVTDITVVNTRVRNPSGEEVVIPNENVLNATITNRTSLDRLRLSVAVGVDYDADIETAEDVIEDAITDVSRILDTPAPQVVPTALGDSAIVLECRFWITHPSPAKRSMATAAVVRAVKTALDDADIDIPYPHRQLLTEDDSLQA